MIEAGAAVIAFDILFAEPAPELGWIGELQDDPLLSEEDKQLLERIFDPAKGFPADPDQRFAEVISLADTVVAFAFAAGRADGFSNLLPNPKAGISYAGEDPRPYLLRFEKPVVSLPDFESAATGYGGVNAPPDRDGIVRRVPLAFVWNGGIYPSFATEVVRVASGAGTILIRASQSSGNVGFGGRTGIIDISVGAYHVPPDRNGRMVLY